MATITSNGTGGGNWATGATWVGGVKPGNTDSVVLAASDVVTYDEDMSGWANGIAGLTLGANSALVASTSAGAYYLKMAGNITASGAGAELRAGTAETAYPTDCTFTIYMNGNYSIDGGASNYLTCKFYCYDPPVKYLRLISATPKAITGISKANPCTVTCVGHGKSGGDIIYLVNVGGMVEVNNLRVRVKTVLTADTFTLRAYDADVEIDSTYFTTYTSGGYVCPETAESAAQTVLAVDQDVSADAEWTRSGAKVNIDNVNRVANSEARTISSVAAGSVTVSSGLTALKHSSTLVILTSRNVTIQSSSTNVPNGIIYRGSGHILRCASIGGNNSTAHQNQCNTITFSGVASGFGSPIFNCTSATFSGIATGISTICNLSYGAIFTAESVVSGSVQPIRPYYAEIRGLVSGCSQAIVSGNGSIFTGTVIGCSQAFYQNPRDIISGIVLGCTYAIQYCAGSTLNNSKFIGCKFGIGYSSAIKASSATICASEYGIYISSTDNANIYIHSTQYDTAFCVGTLINSLLSDTIESYGYNLSVNKATYFDSFDHDATAGAFRAWTRGGITSSNTSEKPTGRTRSYQSVCQSETYPCWHQREILVEAGRTLFARVWGKADSGVDLKIQLVLPTADPLVTGSGIGEWEQDITDDTNWHEYITSWTNSASVPVTIYLRFLATAASGNAYTDFEWTFDQPTMYVRW